MASAISGLAKDARLIGTGTSTIVDFPTTKFTCWVPFVDAATRIIPSFAAIVTVGPRTALPISHAQSHRLPSLPSRLFAFMTCLRES